MDPDDGLLEDRGRIQVISPLVISVHAIYNTEVPSCSRNICVSVCLYVCENCYLSIHYDLFNVL